MEKFFFERKNELGLEVGVLSQETCQVSLTMWEQQFDCVIKQTGKMHKSDWQAIPVSSD